MNAWLEFDLDADETGDDMDGGIEL